MRRIGLAAVMAAAVAVGAAPAAAQDTRPEFVIAVLGDSYASGEGSPDDPGSHSFVGRLNGAECFIDPPAGRKPCHAETWWEEDTPVVYPQGDDPGWATATRRCHRSSRATGPRGADRIQDRFPEVKVVVLNFACSGAQLTTGLLEPYAGIEPSLRGGTPLPPQVQQLESYVSGTSRDIDAIVMNAGGNDARFGDVVTACIFAIGSCSDDDALRDDVLDHRLGNSQEPAYPSREAPLRSRYAVLDAAFRNASRPAGLPGLVAGRPDEVYLTSVPNPSHAGPPPGPAGNPQNFCDGSQTNDILYSQLNRSESEFVEQVAAAMNARFADSAADHGWIFVDGIFEAFRDHGVCADANSFFRTIGQALRIQGNDLPLGNLGPFSFVVPVLSAGVVHPNPSGFSAASVRVRDTVGEQVRMLTRPPALTLGDIEPNAAFTVNWRDPSPLHAPETRWELELDPPVGATERIFSDGPFGDGLTASPSGDSTSFQWRVARTGEYTMRVRGCRATPTGFYCGPFSNAVVGATNVPGTPTEVRRTAVSSISRTGITITWTPGPNTPASVTYEVRHGPFGPVPCPSPPFRPGGTCGNGIQNPQDVSTTSTTFSVGGLSEGDTHAFAVRACSTAGCSPFSPVAVLSVLQTLTQVQTVSLVGTFNLRAPDLAEVGQPALVDVGWRTPRRWTDLDRVNLVVRDGRRVLGTIQFTQDDRVFWVRRGRKRRFGHADEERTLRLGDLGLDLSQSAVLQFGRRARSVGLRLALVLGESARGRSLRLELGGRNDRGRAQRARVAGTLVVSP